MNRVTEKLVQVREDRSQTSSLPATVSEETTNKRLELGSKVIFKA